MQTNTEHRETLNKPKRSTGVMGLDTHKHRSYHNLHKPNRCTEHTSCVGMWAGYPQTQKDTKKLWVWEWIPTDTGHKETLNNPKRSTEHM